MKHKRSNRTYHLRNWSDYNKALVNRGSLTIWFAEETVKAWINHEEDRPTRSIADLYGCGHPLHAHLDGCL